MQADHLAERQQQAEGEHGEHRGLPGAPVLAEPVHQLREGNARERSHRRNDEDEMADAVIERRALHHRDDQRQRCRQHQHQEDGLAPRRHILARQRHEAAGDTGSEQAEQHLGQL
jgi:hypothetical protein